MVLCEQLMAYKTALDLLNVYWFKRVIVLLHYRRW